MKPQTDTSQVSVMTRILCFRPYPGRQDMDPQADPMLDVAALTLGPWHTVTAGILWGCAGCGLQWWSSLENRCSGPRPWVLQDTRVTGATSTSAAALVPTGGEEA